MVRFYNHSTLYAISLKIDIKLSPQIYQQKPTGIKSIQQVFTKQQMENNKKKLKTLLCQLHPKLHQKKTNISRVTVSLQQYSAENKLDIVMFPEMSFTGYNFKDYEDAYPLATKYGDGQEFDFCIGLAKRLKSYVAFGYIEKTLKGEHQVLYNSAAVIDRQGNLILNYRKTHLYFCDQLWCKQGDGFKSLDLINNDGKTIKCAIAICMDINAKQFTSGEYELGDYMVQNKIQALLFLTNWTDSEPGAPKERESIINMYEYWLHRLRPVLNAKNKKQVIFLSADRVGTQHSYFDKKDIHFLGGSCGIMMNPIYLIQHLGKTKEGYLLIQTQLPQ